MEDAALYTTENYEVVLSLDVLGEDGNYAGRIGYAVRNIETGVVEHTTMMLPGAIFQAQHFNDTLKGLLAEPEDNVVPLESIDIPEDVVPS